MFEMRGVGTRLRRLYSCLSSSRDSHGNLMAKSRTRPRGRWHSRTVQRARSEILEGVGRGLSKEGDVLSRILQAELSYWSIEWRISKGWAQRTSVFGRRWESESNAPRPVTELNILQVDDETCASSNRGDGSVQSEKRHAAQNPGYLQTEVPESAAWRQAEPYGRSPGIPRCQIWVHTLTLGRRG
jgi:hypothetical protein